jgi:protein-S-isoprenylcysteine O-methyltransferase Ste14
MITTLTGSFIVLVLAITFRIINACHWVQGASWALLAFLPPVPVLVFRIVNEERVLLRELPGYAAYCQKTRYRLVPFVW